VDIENAAKTNALYRMLCDVENLRFNGGNWIEATYGATSRFPTTVKQKAKALVGREQKKNRDGLLDLLHKVGENPQKLDEIALEMVRSQQFNAALAQMEAATAGQLLNFLWGTLEKRTEE